MDNQRNAIFKKTLALLLAFALMLGTLPGMTAYAEGGVPLCTHAHDSSCGYAGAAPCGHTHDETCGYAEVIPETPCDMDCEGDAHAEGCAYTPAAEGAPCGHTHNVDCGYIETVPCGHVCDEACGGLALGRSDDSAAPSGAVIVIAFDALPEFVAAQAVPLGTSLSALVLPDTLDAVADGADETISGVVWEPSPAFDPGASGEYIFTAKLPEGYKLAGGVNLPEITVTVDAAASTDELAPSVTFAFDPDEPLYLTDNRRRPARGCERKRRKRRQLDRNGEGRGWA